MKQLLLILLIALMASPLAAQVIEDDLSMSEGVQNALTVQLDGADKKKAENIWKKYSKEFGKLERNKKAKEYVLSDAIIPAVDTEYPITVFTKFDEYDDQTRAYFWFKMDDRFLNSIDDENEVNGIDVFLKRYDIEVEKEVVKEELKREEKALKKVKREYEKLQKKNKKLHKEIEDAKKKIANAEKDIEQNVKDQEVKKEELEEQQRRHQAVSDKMNKVGKN